MKTYHLSRILKALLMCIALTIGTNAAFAQGRGHDRDDYRGHGRDNDHRNKENKHFFKGNRGRDYHYAPPARGHERVYYSRAPWGVHRPSIISHRGGRLYYYGGHYYDYYPERGYFIVEAPDGYYFDEVPRGFTRVWIDNSWCYHRGDFYLRPSTHGYISFSRPGLSIGASF